MPKTIAGTHGIDLPAFDCAAARIEALRKVKVQAEHITEIQQKFRREEMRELEHLNILREAAEKIGAYEFIATAARAVS